MALHTPLSDYYGDASKTAPDDSPESRASKLFVGGLSPSTTPQMLNMYFSRFGTVEATSVKLDPSGVSRGFGFVKLASPDLVARIIDASPHQLDGRVIDVKRVVQSDDSSCKIFIGGLTLSTTDEMLRKYFSEYGNVLDGSIRRDVMGKPRGFGFVVFSQPQSVEAVLMSSPHTIDGKQVDPKRVFKETRDPESGYAVPKLFIGGLHLQTTQETLTSYYSQFGSVQECNVVIDPSTGKRRGFGFVRFADQEALENAMANRPHAIDGKQVDPKRALLSEKPENLVSTKKIFVGGLKGEHTQDVLRDYFSQFGKVVLINMPARGAQEGREHRGFAFVDFDDYDSADRVILQRTHVIAGYDIDVRKGLTKEEKMKVEQTKRERDQRDMRALPPHCAAAGGGMGDSHSWMAGGGQSNGYGGYGAYGYGGAAGAGGYGYGGRSDLPGYGAGGMSMSMSGYGGPSGGGLSGVPDNAAKVKGEAFKSLLLSNDVSSTALESLAKENLLDSVVLSALTLKEFERLPISIGDRKRIEIALKSMR